jgi:hypothetical protein
MGRATNTAAYAGAGCFATSRRGGLSYEEIRQIEAHRAKERPTSFQNLAQMYGQPVAVLQGLFQAAPPKEEPAPEVANDGDFQWTERADKLLRLAYGEMASSAADVAKMIGCTKAAVIGRAYRLGVKHGGGR